MLNEPWQLESTDWKRIDDKITGLIMSLQVRRDTGNSIAAILERF